jgi:hypothetical protein
MTNMAQRPPAGESFVWQTHALRTSDAWRSAGINARRFVDFLLIEHMNHGGRANGLLKAPYRQLEAFGIPSPCVAEAIREAEELGLVDCHRGGIRIATTYAITWLPLHNSAGATNRWRTYRNPDLAPVSQRVSQPVRETKTHKSALKSEGRAALKSEGRWGKSALKSEGRIPQKSALKSEGAYKKNSYQDGAISKNLYKEEVDQEESGKASERGRLPQLADHPSSGKPNGNAHDMTAQREIAAVVPLRVRHGKEISK